MDEATTRVIAGLMDTIERQNKMIQKLQDRGMSLAVPGENAEAGRRRHMQATARTVDQQVLGVERPRAVGE